MATDEVAARVRRVLEVVLQRPLAAGDNLDRKQETRWDSLQHVEVIFMLEDEFDIQFSEQEMAELDSSAGLTEAVERHLEA